jgi:hypothetical protein
MNRISTFSALTLMGAMAFSPVLAFAQTPTSASANINVNLHAANVAQHAGMNIGAHIGSSTGPHMQKQVKDAQDRIDAATMRGGKLVDSRVSMLQKLETRISDMTRLSSDEKDSLSTDITAQINELVSLKAKIGDDTSTSSIVADIKTIRPDYRSFLLTLPRAALMAAADRELDIAAQMDTVGDKLETRISDAKDDGKDVSASETAYADFKDKVADAKVQAQAAIDLVKDLKADNGDKTELSANLDALKNARAKVKASRQDLVAARKDMATIMQGIGVHVDVQASSTADLK